MTQTPINRIERQFRTISGNNSLLSSEKSIFTDNNSSNEKSSAMFESGPESYSSS